MTSRVQKGAPIFRPLARQKSRPATASQGVVSRQPTIVAEQEQNATYPSSGTIPLPVSIFPNVSQTPLESATVATSVSIPLAPNFGNSVWPATSSQQGAPPVLPPSIVPTASPVISIAPQPPHPRAIPVMPLTQSFESFLPSSNVLHNSVTENTLVHPTPPSNLNAEKCNKHPEKGNATADKGENGKDATVENDTRDSSKGSANKSRSHRSSTKNTAADEEGNIVDAARSVKRRKRTTKPKTGDDHANGQDAQKPRRKRRRKTHSPSPPPFDPDVDPGEDIDPTVVTMASLCSDTGQGRVSSKAQEILNNHATWKASNRERRARMKTIMERKKYGQPEDEDDLADASNPAPSASAAETSQSVQPSLSLHKPASTSTTTSAAAPSNANLDSFDYTQNLASSRFNVQVRIGPNGETVIDEESLFVDREGDAEDDTIGYTHVIESDRSKFTNSSTYGTKLRGTRWSAEETELFYEALSQYGENYELISYVLPGRDRKSCKNKFKAEDKKNPARINFCLNNSVPVDITTLSRMTGRDFSGPTPEIAMSKPAESVVSSLTTAQAEAGSSECTSAQERHRDNNLTSKSRNCSRSRTAGPLEEGLVVIGDLDTFIDHDGE
ncbi:hypothetical protein F5050DRAFT_1766613 [Lentinula boryana]|uniref:Myb-like domain-containing protein n=1 Tax=Lentinula boryana TaxID=40481 RepID=A0ABQ8QAK2_9AGAR|nr:hypothetical protein F5050DRAFT_1766613 [Lentinula boryana]